MAQAKLGELPIGRAGSVNEIAPAAVLLQSLDIEFDVSLGSVDSRGAIYDNLQAYDKVPDSKNPAVLREDTSVRTDKPNNLALRGSLAVTTATISLRIVRQQGNYQRRRRRRRFDLCEKTFAPRQPLFAGELDIGKAGLLHWHGKIRYAIVPA
jgi:hypothetical protein